MAGSRSAPPDTLNVNAPMEVWRFCDGKPGHERQTAGLVAALSKRRALKVRDVTVAASPAPWWQWLRGIWPMPPGAGAPSLLVGAGRACQWPLLAARKRYGGRAIYCMKPALPSTSFDLCLIPQHDGARQGPHVEPTFGVLNDIQPGDHRDRSTTFVMIGGPSRHHGWDEATVLLQLSTILARAEGPCIITDSRRTPSNTRAALAAFVRPGITFQPSAASPPDWLAGVLATAHQAWVTADSISMIFEALTARLGVGLIDVRARRNDRINRLTDSLVNHGQVTAFSAWQQGERLHTPQPPVNEAARCADLILARWP